MAHEATLAGRRERTGTLVSIGAERRRQLLGLDGWDRVCTLDSLTPYVECDGSAYERSICVQEFKDAIRKRTLFVLDDVDVDVTYDASSGQFHFDIPNSLRLSYSDSDCFEYGCEITAVSVVPLKLAGAASRMTVNEWGKRYAALIEKAQSRWRRFLAKIPASIDPNIVERVEVQALVEVEGHRGIQSAGDIFTINNLRVRVRGLQVWLPDCKWGHVYFGPKDLPDCKM